MPPRDEPSIFHDLVERRQQASIDFIKTEFDVSLMFRDVARAEFGMGEQAAATRAIEKAEKRYDTIIQFLPGVKDPTIREEIRREALELRFELDEVQALLRPRGPAVSFFKSR